MIAKKILLFQANNFLLKKQEAHACKLKKA